jgi:hypothetical protein
MAAMDAGGEASEAAGRGPERGESSEVRHNPLVPWRRFLIIAAVLLLASSIIGAIGTQRRLEGGTGPKPPAPPTRPAAQPEVAATLPAKADVRASLGDVVRLTVRSKVADTVEIPGLGVHSPVDELAPGELVFVADQPGRFAVLLRDQREPIGVLEVRG